MSARLDERFSGVEGTPYAAPRPGDRIAATLGRGKGLIDDGLALVRVDLLTQRVGQLCELASTEAHSWRTIPQKTSPGVCGSGKGQSGQPDDPMG